MSFAVRVLFDTASATPHFVFSGLNGKQNGRHFNSVTHSRLHTSWQWGMLVSFVELYHSQRQEATSKLSSGKAKHRMSGRTSRSSYSDLERHTCPITTQMFHVRRKHFQSVYLRMLARLLKRLLQCFHVGRHTRNNLITLWDSERTTVSGNWTSRIRKKLIEKGEKEKVSLKRRNKED